MDIKTGHLINEGKLPIPDEATVNELLQLSMGAVLEDDGNIWCLQCNRPNECCKCGMYDEGEE